MPEEATIDAPETTEAPPPRSQGFDLMKEKLDKALLEVSAPAKPEPSVDTRPVDQPPLKAEPKPGEKDKKAEAPKTEADKKEPEPFVSPKAADWKKLKAERDELAKKATEHETTAKTHSERAAALEKEYAEYKARTAVDPKEIESLKQKHEQMQAHLERVALEQTPKFKDYYNSKFEAALTQALDAAGKEKSEQIKAVLEAPKSAWRKGILNEIVGGLESEVDKLNLIAAVNEYDRTRDERSKQLDNHKSALQELKALEDKQKKEREDRVSANRQNMLKEVLTKASSFDSFKTTDDAEHNAQVDKNRKMVESLINGSMEDNVVVMLPVLAAEGERLIKVTATQQAKITELEEALAKYKSVMPSLDGGGAPKTEKEKPQGFAATVLANLPKSG